MSGALYAALAVVAVVFITSFALWLGMRSARREGAADASRDAARQIAEQAKAAAGVANDVRAAPDGDAARQLRERWKR